MHTRDQNEDYIGHRTKESKPYSITVARFKPPPTIGLQTLVTLQVYSKELGWVE